jgi:hypothetical protein
VREYIYENLKLTAVERSAELCMPELTFVSDSLGQHLVNIGMFEQKSRVTNDLVSRGREASDPTYSLDNLRDSQTDILGHYCTNMRDAEIKLYVDSCVRASKDLSVPVYDLLQIVLIHEIAHHATAWAVIEAGEEGPIYTWHDYNECDGGSWASVHEFFAQALTFVCIVEHHEELLDAFRKLSRQQSSVYRSWSFLMPSPKTRSGPTRFAILCGLCF